MELRKILARVDAVVIPKDATITLRTQIEDGAPYGVWNIETGDAQYILKEAKGNEVDIYQSILASFPEGVPALYQVIPWEEKNYLLMEYVQGEDLCRCNRAKLTRALDALIGLQQKTWENQDFDHLGLSFEKSVLQRQNRGKYLNDSLLEAAYAQFMRLYEAVPKALCHDDLLPFNVIASDEKAVLIDWEVAGMLPYPTSFARLIAYGEEKDDALFYMTQADRDFAVAYYYQHLLKEKGISYREWLATLEYFLFYEYCEWVFVGNKYAATDGEYYQKYLPIAKQQAKKLLEMSEGEKLCWASL